jgi:uncharacterized protein (TIGR02391 family)
MARTPKQPEKRQANLSFQAMQVAIPLIDRRLADLDAFDPGSVLARSDPRIGALSNKLDDCLVSIFGADTVEYERYKWQVTELDTAGLNIYGTPIEQVREGLVRGKEQSKAQLEGIKSGFLEKLGDAGRTKGSKTLKAYEGLELHPDIEHAAGQLFRDGHYASAILEGVKALNARVRLRSGVGDKDGSNLMEFVFNPKNPVLKFNVLADQSDADEQRGFMMMLSGAVAGLRNPRAHKIVVDDPEMALEFIAFVSLLAKLVDASMK